MADPIQGVPGTITTVTVPDSSAAPKARVSAVDTQAAAVGTSAPAPAVSAAQGPSLELSSAAQDVLASMVDMPPKINIEAVDRIKSAIASNQYPVDVDKITSKLLDSVESLSQ